MGVNELILRKKGDLVADNKNGILINNEQVVRYCLCDAVRYNFESKISENITLNMYEAERDLDCDEFIDAEFEDELNDDYSSYYRFAAASGVLSGIFGQLKMSKGTLEKINEWTEKEWDKYILIIAKKSGYNRNDFKGAKKYLKDRIASFVMPELEQEVTNSIDKWLKALSGHPSMAGLVFSVFTQYSEKKYFFDDNNNLVKEDVPDYYAIGSNDKEKIIYGVLYWFYNMAVESNILKSFFVENIKITNEIKDLLKNLSKCSMFKKISDDFINSEKFFSEIINKVFEKNKKDENDDKISIKTIIETFKNALIEGSIPVLINECVVRSFYFIRKLIDEIKEKNINSFDELEKVDINNIIPFNNRVVSKMILISSGCFLGLDVAVATAKALGNGSGNGKKFSKTLFAEINITGLGRFIFACIADSKYWCDDIKIKFERKEKNKKENSDETEFSDVLDNDVLNILSLNELQLQVLYSLQNLVISNDIENTIGKKTREQKKLWQELWQQRILSVVNDTAQDYFINDEKEIYSTLHIIEQSEDEIRQFYLMTMELVLFEPYHSLGVNEDKEFKKLKTEKYNYVDDQFVRRQTVVSQYEVDSIRDKYKKYKGIVSGNTKNTIIAAGVSTVTALTTGGLAMAFAPQIATLIAGEAVVGLHGAALTSASLAIVGGGSLAAGGLGMAGGTVIITGGGALIGIAGSGCASMAAILSQTEDAYWERQSVKLLVFSNCVVKNKLNDAGSIKLLINELENTISKLENNLNELEEENCSLDRDTIKRVKSSLKYLKRCNAELIKINKD